jgi:hypothetical protein
LLFRISHHAPGLLLLRRPVAGIPVPHRVSTQYIPVTSASAAGSCCCAAAPRTPKGRKFEFSTIGGPPIPYSMGCRHVCTFACGASRTKKKGKKNSNITLYYSGLCVRCSVQPVRTLCPLLSAASSGLCFRCSVQPVRGSVMCPLLSAAISGLCPHIQCSQFGALCPLLSAAISGLCARCSVQPVQGSVSAAQCTHIRALCPLLSAASSGLCVR